jgi:choline dehydrogenase-like flavoprotein
VDEAIEEGATLEDGAEVKSVIIEGKRAVGVEYTSKGKRENRRALAPLVIVSASGIGTASILRRMGIEEAGCDFFIDAIALGKRLAKHLAAA